MTTCTRCGKTLGWFEHTYPGTTCKACNEAVAAEHERACRDFRDVLSAISQEQGDRQSLLLTLHEKEPLTGLSPETIAGEKQACFRTCAERALLDDIITEEEEHSLTDLASAFDIQQDDLRTGLRDLLNRFVIARVNDGRMPELHTSQLITKKGEHVHLETDASLLKEVTDREYRGGYSGLSFSIVRGMRYHIGGTRGHSVVTGTHSEPTDTGILSVSSLRAVFLGRQTSIEMPFSKLLNMTVFTDGIQFHLSNRKAAPKFKVESGDVIAAVVSGAVQRLEL